MTIEHQDQINPFQKLNHHHQHQHQPNVLTPALRSQLEPPAETDTEKVKDDQAGWEMWVADENLMNELGSHLSPPPQSKNNNPNCSNDPKSQRKKSKKNQKKQSSSSSSATSTSSAPSSATTDYNPNSSSNSNLNLNNNSKISNIDLSPIQEPPSSEQLQPIAFSTDNLSINQNSSLSKPTFPPSSQYNPAPRPYSRSPSPAAIQSIRSPVKHQAPGHSSSSSSSSDQQRRQTNSKKRNSKCQDFAEPIYPGRPNRISSPSSKRQSHIRQSKSHSQIVSSARPETHQTKPIDDTHLRSPDPPNLSKILSNEHQPFYQNSDNNPSTFTDHIQSPNKHKQLKKPVEMIEEQPHHNQLTNSNQPSQKQYPKESSPAPGSGNVNVSPNLIRSTSPSPYAFAYELYDRHVSRVQPGSTNPRQSNPPTLHRRAMPPAQPQAAKPQQGQEVCLECMMRDRDMADVDVLTPGVWARKSDADFEEALMAELATDEGSIEPSSPIDEAQFPSSSRLRSSIGTSSPGGEDAMDELTANRNNCRMNRYRSRGFANTSRRGSQSREDSSNLHGSESLSSLHKPKTRKKPIGVGQPLTSTALKAWTQMNPPASSHRWKTLQMYLKEQRHYLELEHRAKLNTQLENERAGRQILSSIEANSLHLDNSTRSDYNFLNTVPAVGRGRSHGTKPRSSSAVLLPGGLVVETLDVSKDEKEAAKHWTTEAKNRHPSSSRISSSSIRSGFPQTPISPSPYSTQPGMETLSHASGQHPSHPSPYPPSPSTRAPSPSRFSIASRRSAFTESLRPFSHWSRNRRSGSNSIFSFAASGSMIDMHLGISQDRHCPSGGHQPFLSSPRTTGHLRTAPDLTNYDGSKSPSQILQTSVDLDSPGANVNTSPRKDKTKLKRRIRGLLVKLGLGKHKTGASIDPNGMGPNQPRNSPRSGYGGVGGTEADDEPLAPPPPLSVLAREQQSHRRNRSALSLPLSTGPKLNGYRPQSISTGLTGGGGGADSGLSSPVSQFAPPSPGFSSGAAIHIDPNNRQHLDSLAEELNTTDNSRSQQNRGDLRRRTASIGSGPRISPLYHQNRTSQSLGGNINQMEGIVAGGVDVNDEERFYLGSSPPKRGVSPEESATGRGGNESIKTVMSKSSKLRSMFNFPFRRSDSVSINFNSPQTLSPTIGSKSLTNFTNTKDGINNGEIVHGRREGVEYGGPVEGAEGVIEGEGEEGVEIRDEHNNNYQNHQQIDSSNLKLNSNGNNKDYLPIEKTKQGISRSNDFLALRYLSLAPET